jgi:hypothetical protein
MGTEFSRVKGLTRDTHPLRSARFAAERSASIIVLIQNCCEVKNNTTGFAPSEPTVATRSSSASVHFAFHSQLTLTVGFSLIEL